MTDIEMIKEKFKDLSEILNLVSENLQVNGYQNLQSILATKFHALAKDIDKIKD